MSREFVSCIVPVHNGERFLAACLNSIIEQTFAVQEVLVVDDGSTDGSVGVAETFGDGVRCIRQKQMGPAAARNTGLKAAHGDFIAFLDADDLWHPEKLAIQISRFRQRESLDLCMTYLRNFVHGQEPGRWTTQREADDVRGFTPCTLLAKRNIFDSVGMFPDAAKHTHSAQWFVEARQAGAVEEVLPEVLVYRRLHGENRSLRHAARSHNEFLDFLKSKIDQQHKAHLS